jgi:nucleoside-diphosphate-sugar epimerase
MKVFVTGGTGAIGRFVVPVLHNAGHEVTALARRDEKAKWLEGQGARPVEISLFDVDALTGAFAGHDVIANLATAIPRTKDALKASAWEANTRIRTEGSTAVVDGALAADVPRLIQESISFTYADGGDRWLDEREPIDVPPGIDAVGVAEANANRFTDADRIGIVLRFGFFYGAGSAHTDEFIRLARHHIGPVAGRSHAYQSSIHLADAASAVLAGLDAPAGIYNVVDDEPLTNKEYARAVGAAVGKRPWIHFPGRFASLVGKKSEVLTRSHRVSNAKFKEATGWSPRYPSAREGWLANETVKKETVDA